MPGTVIGGELAKSVCVPFEKCCCFLTPHGTSYGTKKKRKKREHASVLRLNDQADMIQRVPRRLGAPFGTCRRLSAYRRANGQPIGHGRFRLNLNEGVSVRLLP